MYGLLDISTGGMIAQRTRMTAISANIANRNSVHADGSPYRAKRVFLSAGDPGATTRDAKRLGVHVREISDDPAPFGLRWDPSSPLAVREGPARGYVRESNVNPIVEQVNAIQASRAYEANVMAAEATKAMMAQALRLIA